MANINKLIPIILKWEGGSKFTDDPVDKGGKSKYGITEATWRRRGYDKNGDGSVDGEDVRLLDENDFKMILKIGYWDIWKADYIKNQSIANVLVDWVWGSGIHGVKIPQELLGVTVDGNVGKVTIDKLNSVDQKEFHAKIIEARKQFLNRIVEQDIARIEAKLGKKLTAAEQTKLTNKRFIKGWLNRLADFTYSDN